jgi:hypothetical protein
MIGRRTSIEIENRALIIKVNRQSDPERILLAIA